MRALRASPASHVEAYHQIVTIADITRYNARRFPDKPALLFEGNTTTMAELDRLTSRFANGLIEAGIQPGDRVVFYGSNSDGFFIARSCTQ